MSNYVDDETYELLVKQIDSLIEIDEPTISNLSNITAAIKQTLNKASWVGFYIVDENSLFLGPFQGKIACTKIDIGKGVCGATVEKKQTHIVDNVHEFQGHIACDVDTKAEIVIPLIKDDTVIGVLDIDSTEFSAFNDTDKLWLENICNLIVSKINFSKFSLDIST